MSGAGPHSGECRERGGSLIGFDAVIEAKIAEAQRDGAFDDLPGAGKPLALGDDRLVPEELRMACRILKNAGFVPPEIEDRKEAANLRQLIATAAGAHERRRAFARLALLEVRLEARGIGMPRALDYEGKLAARFARGG